MRNSSLALFALSFCLFDGAGMVEGAVAPSNDDRAHSRILQGRRITAQGTTVGATLEADELHLAAGKTVWFDWTAPVDGVFRISLTPEDSAQATVFIGQYGLSQRTGTASQAVLDAERGAHYKIRVNGYQNGSPFTLRIRPVQPPPNDDFADAIDFSGTNTVIDGTVLNSTYDGDTATYYYGEGNVWYRWEALSDGLFLASIASDFEATQARIYQGTNILYRAGYGIIGLKHGTAFYATNGGVYWIAADGYSAFASNFTLTVSAETPPPNDHFTNSTVVVGEAVSVMGSSMGATFVSGEPSNVFPRPPPPTPTPGPATPPPLPPGPVPSPSLSIAGAGFPVLSEQTGYVWYSWTAPTTGAYRISAKLILPPPTGLGRALSANVVVVLSGDSLPELTQVASGYTESGALLRATAGENYHVAVPGGKYSFHFEIEPIQLPPNDDYTNAIMIAGAFVTVSGSTLNATPEPSSPYSDSAVWYRWTAPSNGFFAMTVLPVSHRLAVYSGDNFATAELLHHGDVRPVVRALAGREYRIGVAQAFFGSNAFTLNIEPVNRPANDDFANSEVLTGVNIDFTAQVQNATREENEPGTAWAAARDTVWFSWTAPADGQYTVRFPTNLARLWIFTGTSFWTLENVSGNSQGFSGVTDAAFFGAHAGTNYVFSVDDTHGYASDIPLELRLLPRPANDHFADSIPLSGANVSVRGTLAGSTKETEGADFTSGTSQSIWWSWTAPRSGRARIEVNSPLMVLVYTGNALPELTYITLGSRFEFSVEKGAIYHLAVMGDNRAAPVEARLNIRLFDSPSNDAFANRKRLVKRARGTTSGATREEGERDYETDPTGASVWWTWRAPRDGVFELTLSARETWAALSYANLYTGDQLDDLTPVVSANEFGRSLRFRAIAGTSYVIEISNENYAGGDYQIEMVRRSEHESDNFAERLQLSGTNFLVIGNNMFATPEPDEPQHAFLDPQRSVWWTWTAPTNGTVFMNLDRPSKRAAIYTGDSLGELERVAEGYDTFLFNVVAGMELQIAVDSSYYDNAPDPWQFHWLLVPPPANDNFAARTPLAGTNVQVTGTFVAASQEESEPSPYYAAGYSVWWTWTAPETGSYTFRLRAPNTYPILGLYSGSAVDDLESITAVGINFGVAEANVPLTAGEVIAIRTDGSFEKPTDQFELTIAKPAPPPNDDFANRAELVNGRGAVNNEGATAEADEWGYYQPHFSSVWWRFTAASNGWHTLIARLTNSLGAVSILDSALLAGDNITNLSSVPTSERHYDRRFFLTAGLNYSIQVSDDAHRFGIVAVEVRHVPSPANDHFTNATQIIGTPASLMGSNAWATTEPGEPFTFNFWPNESSVWWRWTAQQDGVFLLTLENYGPTVRVFTGTALSNLTVVPQVAYGAVFPGYLFRARGGAEHFIRVTSAGIHEAQFTLQFDQVQSPLNDDFTNRTVIAGQNISLNTSNTFATPEHGDPLTNDLAQQTVWWKWTAPASGLVSLTITNARYLDLGVYVGADLTNLASVVDNPSGFLPKTFGAQAGVEYQIGATTVSDYATEFTLVLDLVPSAPNLAASAISNRGIILSTRANQIIETSTDLAHWTPYRTNAAADTNVTILPRQDEPQRFFRVR